MEKISILILGVLFFGSIVWLVLSELNFRKAAKSIQAYQETQAEYHELEKTFNDTSARASYFLKRMELKERYPELDKMAEALNRDKKALLKQLRKEYYKAGFLYNIYS